MYYYVLLCIIYWHVLLRITGMYCCKSRCVHNMLRCPVNLSMATSRRILWESLDTQQPFSRRDLPLSRAGKPPIFGKTASTVQVHRMYTNRMLWKVMLWKVHIHTLYWIIFLLSMMVFHSYIKLPEGRFKHQNTHFASTCWYLLL